MATLPSTPPNEKAEASKQLQLQQLRRRKQSLRKQIRSRIKSNYPPAAAEKLTFQSNRVFSRLFALPQYRSAESIGFFLSMPSGEIQTRDAIRRIVNDDGKALFVPRVGMDFEKCDMDLVRCDTAAAVAVDHTENDASVDNDGASSGVVVGGGERLFYDGWPRNKWGIPEAPVGVGAANDDAAVSGDIDLLVVPGLAFDAHGHRLGQGKGYYDRFIAKMRDDGSNPNNVDGGCSSVVGRKRPLLVGVCLEEQFLEEVSPGVDLGDGDDDFTSGIIPVSDHDYIMDMVLTPSRTLTVSKTT